jgi:type III restriction enzyme
MKYSDFLRKLAQTLHINMKTLHESFIDSKADINPYLSATTIRVIQQNFNDYLITNSFDAFKIAYKSVSNSLHPTKLTDVQGNVLSEIAAADVGLLYSNEKVNDSYLFDALYFDSELERKNIKSNETLEGVEVTVFTKIPKNSIKIPVAGGKSYSPDFAYVIRHKNGTEILHFIVETKNVNNENSLRKEESMKIKHAEQFFKGKVKIKFETQYKDDIIVNLIKKIAHI